METKTKQKPTGWQADVVAEFPAPLGEVHSDLQLPTADGIQNCIDEHGRQRRVKASRKHKTN